MNRSALCGALTLASCLSAPPDPPGPDTPDPPKTAAAPFPIPASDPPPAQPAAEPAEAIDPKTVALSAFAAEVTGAVVMSPTHTPLGTLAPEVLETLRTNLSEGALDDLTAATPPWDVTLEIASQGRPVLVVIPVGIDRGRIEPTQASALDGRYEVLLGEPVHDAIRGLVGAPTAKEFQTPPRSRRRRPAK